MHCARHRFLARTRRTRKKQRLAPLGLTRDTIAQLPDSAAAAEQRPLHAAACFAEECLCDAQFALERCGSFRFSAFGAPGGSSAADDVVDAEIVDEADDKRS